MYKRNRANELETAWQCADCGCPMESGAADLCSDCARHGAPPNVRRKVRHQNVVYAVAPIDPEQPIKIGVSRFMINRLGALQSLSPVELEFLGAIYVPREWELIVHDALAGSRAHGEWFHRTRKVMEAVKLIVAGDVERFQAWLYKHTRNKLLKP